MGIINPKCTLDNCCPNDKDSTIVDKAINYKLNILNLNVKLKDNNLIQNINSNRIKKKNSNESKDASETIRLIVYLQRKIRSFLKTKKKSNKLLFSLGGNSQSPKESKGDETPVFNKNVAYKNNQKFNEKLNNLTCMLSFGNFLNSSQNIKNTSNSNSQNFHSNIINNIRNIQNFEKIHNINSNQKSPDTLTHYEFKQQKNYVLNLRGEGDKLTFAGAQKNVDLKSMSKNTNAFDLYSDAKNIDEKIKTTQSLSIKLEEMNEEDLNESESCSINTNQLDKNNKDKEEDMEYFIEADNEINDNVNKSPKYIINENDVGSTISKFTNINDRTFSHKVSFNQSQCPDNISNSHSSNNQTQIQNNSNIYNNDLYNHNNTISNTYSQQKSILRNTNQNQSFKISNTQTYVQRSGKSKKSYNQLYVNNSNTNTITSFAHHNIYRRRASDNLSFGDLTEIENDIEDINSRSSLNTHNNIGRLMRTTTKADMDSDKIKGYFLMNNKNEKYKFIGVKDSNNKKTGFGLIIWENYTTLKGYFTNSKLNGIAEFRMGSSLYQGEYSNNIPKGYGFFTKGKYYLEGSNWYRNFLNKVGVCIWEEGDIYEGEYVNSKKEGIGTYSFPDGTTYKGEWKKDKMNGYGIMKYKNERTYIGEFKDGKINGIGSYYFNNESIYFGRYENEVKHGFGIYVNCIKPISFMVGFWYKGKNKGICLKFNNGKFTFSYKKNDKEEKIIKEHEIYKYFSENQKKYKKFFEKNPKTILRFIEEQIINKDIELFSSYNNYL